MPDCVRYFARVSATIDGSKVAIAGAAPECPLASPVIKNHPIPDSLLDHEEVRKQRGLAASGAWPRSAPALSALSVRTHCRLRRPSNDCRIAGRVHDLHLFGGTKCIRTIAAVPGGLMDPVHAATQFDSAALLRCILTRFLSGHRSPNDRHCTYLRH